MFVCSPFKKMLLMMAFIGFPSFALADDCEKLTKMPDVEKGIQQVVIDANDGHIISGSRVYPDGTKIRPIIVNKNPYRYKYSFSYDIQSLDASIARDFLSLIPGFGDVLKTAIGKSKSEAQDNECKETVTLKKSANDLGKNSQQIKDKLADLQKIKDDYDQFYADTMIDRLADPTAICRRANSLRPKLNEIIDLGNLPDLVKKLKKNVEDIEKKFAELEENLKNESRCESALNDLKAQKEDLRADVNSYENILTKITDNKEAYKVAAQVIDDAQNQNAFNQVLDIIEVNEASEITISGERTDRRTKDAKPSPIGPVKITIGQSMLHLSAGIGFSTIPDRKIIRQASLSDDGTTVVNRFGYENNSSFKPSGIVMLNATVVQDLFKIANRPTSFGLSTGLVVSARDNSTEIEYFGGGFLGFLRDRVYVNFGLHAARVQQLSGNFKIGDIVPDKLSDPLPIQKDFKAGFMIAITYRLR